MEIVVNIALVALCLAAVALFIAAIGVLRRAQQTVTEIGRSVDAVTKELSTLSSHVTPLVDSLKETADRAASISRNIDEQVAAFKNVAASVNQFAKDIVDFEQKFKSSIQEPVLDGTLYVRAVARGIKAFLRVMRADD